MRKTQLRSLVVAGCMCGIALAAAADERPHRTYQTANIFQFGNPSNRVAGGATLLRSRHGAEMRIATSGLNQNAAYTVWWVVFNNPEACVGGCAGDDLGNPAVDASVFYAAGFVTGMDGTGNVSAHMAAGALAEGLDVVLGTGLKRGNGFRAEIHLVVRSHGAITPGTVDQQIGSFNGGCAPCADQQAAVFLPVE